MKYTFTAVFLRAENGGVDAYLEEFPGAVAHAATIATAHEALKLAAEFILARNRRFTAEPSQTPTCSGANSSRSGAANVGEREGQQNDGGCAGVAERVAFLVAHGGD